VTVLNGFVDTPVTVTDGSVVVTHGRPFATQSAVFLWQSACDAVQFRLRPSLTNVCVSLGNDQGIRNRLSHTSGANRDREEEADKTTIGAAFFWIFAHAKEEGTSRPSSTREQTTVTNCTSKLPLMAVELFRQQSSVN
jgi:hypothetical protein